MSSDKKPNYCWLTSTDLEYNDTRLTNPRENRESVNEECREQQSGKKEGKKAFRRRLEGRGHNPLKEDLCNALKTVTRERQAEKL